MPAAEPGGQPRELYKKIEIVNPKLVTIGGDHRPPQAPTGTPTTTPSPQAAAQQPRQPRGAAFWVALTAIATAALAVVAVTALLTGRGEYNDPYPPPDAGDAAAPGGAGLGGEAFDSRIARTWDVDSGSFIGVRAYADPGPDGRDTEVGHYLENHAVRVSCMITDGREITDQPWQDRPISSTVWYQLAGPRTGWIPGMYLEVLPTNDGGFVPQVPSCRD